jgi:DNA-binding NtrC family response regulator
MARHADELSTINQRIFNPTPPPTSSFRLTVLEGADVGQNVIVDDSSPTRVYVGSADGCHLRLNDRAVSRRHAALELTGTSLRVEDLDSTNGTYVNGIRVRDAFVSGGEVLRLGSTALQVEQGAAQPSALSPALGFGKVQGASREMRRLYPLCERLAQSDVPVLIEGETGTGKEVLAESIHEASARSQAPFIVLDCTAIAPTLIESVLFGHERGAFTGATARQIGVFEEANGGTLFIDEIGDLDISMQPKLLRAIERAEVRRVGSTQWIKVNVRIVSATRRNLDAEIEAGRFRDDLFHRLAVGRIELPPLRARRGDVSLLVETFCAQQGVRSDAIPPKLRADWERAPWPGNVRELRNAVSRYLALGEFSEQTPSAAAAGDLASQVLDSELPFVIARQRVIEDFERRYVERVLAAHGGNVSRAARASGIARRNFQILRARTSKPER